MATKAISLEQEINPWEAQAARFDLAAQKLNLDEGLWKVLRYPNREIIVHIPVAMDNGQLEVFTGFRVQHSIALGGAPRDRVPHPKTGKDFQLTVVHGDRNVHDNLAVRIAQHPP